MNMHALIDYLTVHVTYTCKDLSVFMFFIVTIMLKDRHNPIGKIVISRVFRSVCASNVFICLKMFIIDLKTLEVLEGAMKHSHPLK